MGKYIVGIVLLFLIGCGGQDGGGAPLVSEKQDSNAKPQNSDLVNESLTLQSFIDRIVLSTFRDGQPQIPTDMIALNNFVSSHPEEFNQVISEMGFRTYLRANISLEGMFQKKYDVPNSAEIQKAIFNIYLQMNKRMLETLAPFLQKKMVFSREGGKEDYGFNIVDRQINTPFLRYALNPVSLPTLIETIINWEEKGLTYTEAAKLSAPLQDNQFRNQLGLEMAGFNLTLLHSNLKNLEKEWGTAGTDSKLVEEILKYIDDVNQESRACDVASRQVRLDIGRRKEGSVSSVRLTSSCKFLFEKFNKLKEFMEDHIKFSDFTADAKERNTFKSVLLDALMAFEQPVGPMFEEIRKGYFADGAFAKLVQRYQEALR